MAGTDDLWNLLSSQRLHCARLENGHTAFELLPSRWDPISLLLDFGPGLDSLWPRECRRGDMAHILALGLSWLMRDRISGQP